MTELIIVISIYVFIVSLVLLKGRGENSVSAYTLNSKASNCIDILSSNLGTSIGAGVIFSLIAIGYEAGFTGLYVGLSYSLGFILFALLSNTIIQKTKDDGISTMISFLSSQLTSKKRAFLIVACIINLYVFFFLLAAQFVALSLIIKNIFPVGTTIALFLSALFVILYTSFTGLPGVYETDKIQLLFLSILIFVFLVPISFKISNNYHNILTLPKSFFYGTAYGFEFFIGLAFIAPSVLGRADFWQRTMSAKNPSESKKAFYLTAFIMIIFYVSLTLIGIGIKLGVATNLNSSEAILFIIKEYLPNKWFYAISMVGFVAAIMSTADSFLNILAFNLLKDAHIVPSAMWIQAYNGDIQTNKTVLLKLKISCVILGLMTCLIALTIPNIVDLMVAASSMVIVFVPLTVHALLTSKKIPGCAAFFSVFVGGLINIGLFIASSKGWIKFEPKASFVPAFFFSVLIYILLILFTKSSEKKNDIMETI